eukprot:jgi/Orpsp1_1/1188631/evm.model.d7180000066173.1
MEMKNGQFETCQASSLLPVSVDFYYFICNSTSLEPARWPSELARISDSIRFITMSKDKDDLYSVCPLLHGLSSYAFDRFASFCSSSWCDCTSRNRVFDILGLFKLVISQLDDSSLHISSTLQKLELVRNKFNSRDPINFDQKDKSLFNDLAKLVYQVSPEMYD